MGNSRGSGAHLGHLALHPTTRATPLAHRPDRRFRMAGGTLRTFVHHFHGFAHRLGHLFGDHRHRGQLSPTFSHAPATCWQHSPKPSRTGGSFAHWQRDHRGSFCGIDSATFRGTARFGRVCSCYARRDDSLCAGGVASFGERFCHNCRCALLFLASRGGKSRSGKLAHAQDLSALSHFGAGHCPHSHAALGMDGAKCGV